MNELIFCLHILIVLAFVLIALRLGRGALVAWISLQAALANLFVIKQTTLFGLSVTCSDVFAVGAILSSNLLQEYFGKEAAQKAVRTSLIALLFFVLMSQIHLLYIPTESDTSQASFSTIFSQSPRVILASIGTFYAVQKWDVWFFGTLSRIPLSFRVGISLICSQLLDTVLFTFLGLYGLVESPLHVILVSFLIKCLVIMASSSLIAFVRKRSVDELPL